MRHENLRATSLVAIGLALGSSGCGRNVVGSRGNGGDTPSILDYPRDVMDATAFGVASKAELNAALTGSMALADLAAGRLFDFDDADFLPADDDDNDQPAQPSRAVFCEGEATSLDSAIVEENKLLLRYEADVTGCERKPSDSLALAGADLIVDQQRAAFAMTFTCSSRDLAAAFRQVTSARAILSSAASFACKVAEKSATTGRAYQFATRTQGRIPGPRSDVPVEQWFLRGYDSGQAGAPCAITRDRDDVTTHGSCRLYERTDLTNLVDNSRRGRLISASASQRKRGGSFFADGKLEIRFNGWAGATQLSSQDTEIKVDLTKSGGECGVVALRPRMANFEARDCFR